MVPSDYWECVWNDGVIAFGSQWQCEGIYWYSSIIDPLRVASGSLICSSSTLPAPHTPLADLIASATPLLPGPRAKLIETSETIARAHADAAAQGDTAAPPAEDEVNLHFVAFVKSSQGNLWELDGRRKGPLNRGKLIDEDDVLSPTALGLGVRRFLKREEEGGGGGDLRFSLLALASALD